MFGATIRILRELICDFREPGDIQQEDRGRPWGRPRMGIRGINRFVNEGPYPFRNVAGNVVVIIRKHNDFAHN